MSPSPEEAALRMAQELVKTASLFLKNSVEQSAEAVLVTDMVSTVLHASEGAHEMFGYPSGELEGRSIDDLIPERFRRRHAHHVQEFREEPRTRPMRLFEAVPALHRDGHEFPIKIGLSPVDLDGTRRTVVVVRHAEEA